MSIKPDIAALIFAIMVQTCAGAYWAGSISTRLTGVEDAIAANQLELIARAGWMQTIEGRVSSVEATVTMMREKVKK